MLFSSIEQIGLDKETVLVGVSISATARVLQSFDLRSLVPELRGCLKQREGYSLFLFSPHNQYPTCLKILLIANIL